jgi:glycosyltransferase involved in cell wall biosynthesis
MVATERKSVAFVFWSRRGGALSPSMLELAQLREKRPDLRFVVSVSDKNDLAAAFSQVSPPAQIFRTFASGFGALIGLPRLFIQLRQLIAEWKKDNIGWVVVVMPHVWTPILGYFVRKAGMQYAIMVHDATPHFGDPTAILNPWIHIDIKRADLIFAFSQSVVRELVKQRIPPNRIEKVFLPRTTKAPAEEKRPHSPLRALFLGRILPYKGLPLLVEAIEKLREQGVLIDLGVAGEGDITAIRPRLAALKAEVINQWMTRAQIQEILSRYDVVVLPYIEASQSGVITDAFSAGIPVIVTPVGALPEQVENGVTGLVTSAIDSHAIGVCLQKFEDFNYYRNVADNITALQHDLSIEPFAELVLGKLQRVFPGAAEHD